ncbi:sensor histidine kinase [Vallitalea okinawensis]|uniref:sensor histidine kinase n=1 Tax=Vallitalea okinawensis TaxID=2078660 RepID=UPI000CFBCEDD|nr:HAMP domain-containing sensor histidine kinase [Vallitalea okinawensis]
MKRNSITFKLFSISLIFIIGLLVILGLFQNYLLSDYYTTTKINQLEDNLDDFIEEFLNNQWTEEKLYWELEKFSIQNNASLAVMDSSYFSTSSDFTNDYVVTIEDGNGSSYDVIIDPYFQDEVMYGRLPEKGDEIEVIGFYYEGDFYTQSYYYPVEIILNGISFKDELIYSNEELKSEEELLTDGNLNGEDTIHNEMEDLVTVKGSVVDSDYFFFEEKNANEVIYNTDDFTIYEDPYSSIKYVSIVTTVEKDGMPIQFYLDATLQPVDEAKGIINQYYLVFFIIAILLSLVIAYFFSKMFTRPIVVLNNIAKDMADMNFDKKSPIQSNDEIGMLSESINILSTNLKSALEELTDANVQLKEDIELRVKQEEVRKEFVANVSHDLKTPLGIIKTYAEAIKDGIKKEKSNYYLDVILDEIGFMNSLVMDMLKLSKIESGAVELIKEKLPVKLLLDDVVSYYKPILEEKNMSIHYGGKNFEAVMDKKLMIQVINNLLSNVIDHGNEGTQIEIYMDEVNQRLYFANEGPLIEDREMEKIWDRFYKTEKSRNRALGGTGIGLAIVKSIIESHSFTYGVKNRKNGVEFWIQLKTS